MGTVTRVLRWENHIKPVKPDDNVLLDSAIAYIPEGRKALRWEDLPHWLAQALLRRYGNQQTAKEQVKARIRERRNQQLWPPDWPERADPQPLFRKLEEKGKAVSPKDMEWFTRMCATTRRTRRPPTLNQAEKTRIQQYCPVREALRLMGIPSFKNRGDLRRMMIYWNENRPEGSAGPQ